MNLHYGSVKKNGLSCQQKTPRLGAFRIAIDLFRHSCATLLLNAGAPILTVQTILGHQRVDTTLNYARLRLQRGTVAADYYRAMLQIEHQMALPEDAQVELLTSGQLLALVDTLRNSTLNEVQQATVRVLRVGIVALTGITSKLGLPQKGGRTHLA